MEKEKRIHSIDFLKGLFVIFIIITHNNISDDARLNFLFPFWIKMAVPGFMILSGYVMYKSFKTKNLKLKENYNIKNLTKKLLRFLIPFTMIFILEYLIYIFNNNFSLIDLIKKYLTGGIGQGSYYTPLMIQLLIIFPLIYYIYCKCKNKKIFIFIGFIINILFELLIWAFNIPLGLYRLLLFRYIFLIFFGAYMYENSINKKSIYYLLIFLGALIIYIIDYTKFKMPIINFWVDTSILCAVYIVPIVSILIKKNLHSKIFELFGKASYNIFLIQMCYFYTIGGLISKSINNIFIEIPISIILCLSIGSLFFYFEQKITKKIISLIK